ncbi:hypothetical protein KIPB_007135 [Kipferlia bialata]|uniref:Uncharacterized protein n=1 Tax=Kipferlia bialata TaxID=797122 RepID=A0A9K3D0P4_9EUKA|nr:hypothetical protein KIPB_007135 [Kipferlia bialata]|eukprot:g7135.t1
MGLLEPSLRGIMLYQSTLIAAYRAAVADAVATILKRGSLVLGRMIESADMMSVSRAPAIMFAPKSVPSLTSVLLSSTGADDVQLPITTGITAARTISALMRADMSQSGGCSNTGSIGVGGVARGLSSAHAYLCAAIPMLAMMRQGSQDIAEACREMCLCLGKSEAESRQATQLSLAMQAAIPYFSDPLPGCFFIRWAMAVFPQGRRETLLTPGTEEQGGRLVPSWAMASVAIASVDTSVTQHLRETLQSK